MSKSMLNIIKESFGQYAGAVAQSRAFVDVRDGLKPSTRQINYCLYTDKFLPNKPFKKTLKAIGSIARIYIHGDASAEGIIMRSGQPFSLRYPLMEVEGNGGNLIESGNWAAPRYSGARLSEFGALMFDGIDKDTIDDWRDNYDDTEKYPAVLPTKGFYNLVNGTSGIGVGVASSVPQCNLRDMNRALETLLLNPAATFEEIYCRPDFATGGYLINEKEVKEALKYGSKRLAKENGEEGASCKLRAKIDYNEKESALIVTEIPYSVYTNTICGQLEAILDSEENPGIDRFNDLTGEQPLIKIYLKKGINPNVVKAYLYKNTSLQYHFAINMTMLDMGKFPKVFTWKEALQAHIDHEKTVYRKGFEFDLKKIEHRIHIIDGLLICLASIDEVIQTIKTSTSTENAKENLIKKFLLDDEQAKSVLDMKLARLAKLEVEKLQNEKDNLTIEANKIKDILSNEDLFNQELIKTWREISKKYGDDYRTKIINISNEDKVDKEIVTVVPKDVVVVVSKDGVAKRIPKTSFRTQRKGGKGIKTKDDAILEVIKTNTIDTLVVFTSNGKMYQTLVDNLPETTNAGKGIPLSTLVQMETGESVVAVTSIHRKKLPKYIIFITKQGMIKKSLLEDYMKSNKSKGILATKVKEGDKVVEILFQDDEDIIFITKNGKSLRLASTSINAIGRQTLGVIGIKIDEQDEVVAALSVHKETDQVALVSSKGLGKKVPVSEFPSQGRGGRGVVCYKSNDANGYLVGAAMVSDEDILLLCGANSICIPATDISLVGRTALGNVLIKDSTVVSITKI